MKLKWMVLILGFVLFAYAHSLADRYDGSSYAVSWPSSRYEREKEEKQKKNMIKVGLVATYIGVRIYFNKKNKT